MPRSGWAASGKRLEMKRTFTVSAALDERLERPQVAVVAKLAGVSRAAILGGVEDIHQLARGDEVEAEFVPIVVFGGQVIEKAPHRIGEQRGHVLRDAAVRVELDENPFGPA